LHLASPGPNANSFPAGPVVGAGSLAKATEATPKKSVDAKSAAEETPAEGVDTAKTSKSRSRFRSAPANIIGFFKGKKGERTAEPGMPSKSKRRVSSGQNVEPVYSMRTGKKKKFGALRKKFGLHD